MDSKALCVTINGASCAINVAMYAAWMYPLNLGAAIFSAMVFAWVLTWR